MPDKKRVSGSSDIQEVAAKKLRNISAWLRDYITAIKNGQVHPYSQIERKTREATRNEAWGPTGTRLNQLAEASCSSTDCEIIFAVIQLRLGYPPEKWRNVYKALVVLEFLLLRGSPQCLQITVEDVLPKLTELSSFAFTNPEGKDQGVNVRYRAKAIKDLVDDKDRLQAERQVYQQKRKAYQGYAKSDLALLPAFNDDQALSTPRSPQPNPRRTLSDTSMVEEKQTDDESAEPSAPRIMNAGETKGVTMEMNKKNLEELRQLLSLPHNRYCADCRGGGAASRASWASINNGTFICFRCAGVHRGLGVHISKVRSCTLDTWLPEQVAFMAETGNHKANAFLEANLREEQKPGYDTAELASFIRKKYESRSFAGNGVWPPAVSPLNSARSIKRASEDGQQSASQTDASATLQRKEPRLPGRRSRTGQASSAEPQPVRRMVSVPLPAAAPAAPSQPTMGADVPDLMDFGTYTAPSYSAPARPLGEDGFSSLIDDTLNGSRTDPVLAELNSIEVPYDHQTSVATYAIASSADTAPHQAGVHVPQLPLHTLPRYHSGLPAWRPLRTDSIASSAILTTGAIVLGDGPDPGPSAFHSHYSSSIHPANEHLQTISEGEQNYSFQEDSVQDWGQGLPQGTHQTQPRTQLRIRRSIGGESELASNASTPLFTPRMTALLGPGPQPTWRRNQISAGLTYNPVAMTSNFKPASSKPQGGQPINNLKQAARQLSTAQGGGNTLDELVLHALADIPGYGPTDVHKAERPPSLLQQKAQVYV